MLSPNRPFAKKVVDTTAVDTLKFPRQTQFPIILIPRPADGNVFYDMGSTNYDTYGWCYLEAASETITKKKWATTDYKNISIDDATSVAKGDGMENTEAILDLIGENAPMAYYCRNYSGGRIFRLVYAEL